jgi:hypothetical protein
MLGDTQWQWLEQPADIYTFTTSLLFLSKFSGCE